MRLVITGGTGFIGSRLGLHCLADGHEVVVLGQENTEAETQNRRALEEKGARVVLGSVTDPGVVAQALEGADVVFHFAATQHEMNVPDQRFREVNVQGTRNVFEAAIAAGVKRVVHGSTIGVYGSTDVVIDEDTPCIPDNIYGVTKLEGERVALDFADRIESVVIRIPEVYGPGDRRLVKLFRAIQKRAFFVIGSGKNVHHLIYIDDLIHGFLQAATHPEAHGKVFLLAGSEAVSTKEMATTIAHELGAKLPPVHAPFTPFWMMGTVLEKTFRPMGMQPPFHRRRLDFFRKTFTLSAEKARTTIGFDPKVDFSEGVRRTAEFYKEMGFIGRGSTTHAASGAAPIGASTNGADPKAPVTLRDEDLTAVMEPFDSFWEAPPDIESGYERFYHFYKRNYLPHVPADRNARILCISCGPGYFVNMLRRHGYQNVLGIDSFPDKIAYAERHNLNCRAERAFSHLHATEEPYDCIVGEQEINHMTKLEILAFLRLAWQNLSPGGRVILHSINGTSPLTGAESRAGNYDHYNSFTEYSFQQILEYTRFEEARIFPLDLYVFYTNPLNYVAMAMDRLNSFWFRVNFKMVGKSAKIFTKKIGAVAVKPRTDQ